MQLGMQSALRGLASNSSGLPLSPITAYCHYWLPKLEVACERVAIAMGLGEVLIPCFHYRYLACSKGSQRNKNVHYQTVLTPLYVYDVYSISNSSPRDVNLQSQWTYFTIIVSKAPYCLCMIGNNYHFSPLTNKTKRILSDSTSHDLSIYRAAGFITTIQRDNWLLLLLLSPNKSPCCAYISVAEQALYQPTVPMPKWYSCLQPFLVSWRLSKCIFNK